MIHLAATVFAEMVANPSWSGSDRLRSQYTYTPQYPVDHAAGSPLPGPLGFDQV